MDIYPEIGFVATIIAAIAVALSPLILGLVALRQSRKHTGNKWVRIGFPLAVVLDWVFLVAFFVASSPNYRKHPGISVHIADVFVLVSLVLLIGVVWRTAKVKLSIAMIVLLAVWTWTEQRLALRTDGSMLSVGISMLRDRIGCPPGDWSGEVLHKMAVYAKRGHDDAAIYAGRIWTEKHPNALLNENVLIYMTWLYLDKARHDSEHADEHVGQAMKCRDKAYAIDGERRNHGSEWGIYDISAFADLAALTEAAGDISTKQRCVQYGNAIKLLNLRVLTLKDKQDQIAGRVVPVENDVTVEQVRSLCDETQAAIARVREKQQKHGCQE